MFKYFRFITFISAIVFLLFFIAAGAYVGGFWSFWQFEDQVPRENFEASIRPFFSPTPHSTVSVSPKPQHSPPPSIDDPMTLPKKINLSVSFTSQAPHRNWDLPYKEFCEEASVLMAAGYITHDKILGADDADKKMLDIMEFEERRFGYHEDTGVEDTAIILREYFGLSKINVLYNPTIRDIKRSLAAGRPVIVPAAGRDLGNPYYTPPGPLYHMLVIKGYDDNEFITNDPGTRRGADYRYDEQVLWNAIHDWNGGDVLEGQRAMIIVG